ncbi:hypothetical protein D3C71_1673460 [compost metagenome]
MRDPDHGVVTHASIALEQRAFVEFDEGVDIGAPVRHAQVLAVFGAQFREIQEQRDDAVEAIDLVGVEVVLRDDDVGLAHAFRLPRRQCHVGHAGVGALDDDLCGGPLRDRVEHLVLHFGEEQAHGSRVVPVVH